MGTLRTVSKRVRTLGIVLIVIVGLLNFHLPHFLLESTTDFNSATYFLEFAFLVNLLGAVVAAVGIYRNLRWGWLLGMLIVGVSFVLYLVQETVGLPGLPKMWWEPSRIVSLIVEALFVVLVRYNQSLKRGPDISDVRR
jgi:peptidoglycan/LPS O-acetylase OafA/YrhL